MIINDFEVVVAIDAEAPELERELANALARKLVSSEMLRLDFRNGFCISDDEDLCVGQDRHPVILLAADENPVEDTLERKFEFRFENDPVQTLKRDLLEGAFIVRSDEYNPYVFVTNRVTIVDPYTKRLVEQSLIVSVSKPPSLA